MVQMIKLDKTDPGRTLWFQNAKSYDWQSFRFAFVDMSTFQVCAVWKACFAWRLSLFRNVFDDFGSLSIAGRWIKPALLWDFCFLPVPHF